MINNLSCHGLCYRSNNLCGCCSTYKNLYYSLRGFLPYDCYSRFGMYLSSKCFEKMKVEINRTDYFEGANVHLLVTSWTRLPVEVNLF